MIQLKVLSTISQITAQASELETKLIDLKAEQAIELVHELRLQLKALEAQINEQNRISPLERRLAIHSIITGLKEEGKENGFNNAQMYYTKQFLYDIQDKEFALEFAKALNELYADKKNPQWLEFIYSRTLAPLIQEIHQ